MRAALLLVPLIVSCVPRHEEVPPLAVPGPPVATESTPPPAPPIAHEATSAGPSATEAPKQDAGRADEASHADCKQTVQEAAAVVDVAGTALRAPPGSARSRLEQWVLEKAPKRIADLRALTSGFPSSSLGRASAMTGTLASLEAHLRTGAPYDEDYVAAARELESLPSICQGLPVALASTVKGSLAPEAIQLVVRLNFGTLRACYGQGLLKNRNLRGRVATKFVIDRNGDVSTTADGGSDLPDPTAVDCIVRAFGSLRFARPRGGGPVKVVYPIVFNPGD
jgi:hypothetical protein